MGGGLYLLNSKFCLNELFTDLKKPTFSAKIHFVGGWVHRYHLIALQHVFHISHYGLVEIQHDKYLDQNEQYNSAE